LIIKELRKSASKVGPRRFQVSARHEIEERSVS
jgi:hypothetical protein